MAKHKNFKRFIKRLKRLRKKAVPYGLSKLISKTDLSEIFDFFNITKTQIKIIEALRIRAEIKFKFLQKLMQLSPGGAMRLAKEDTQLSRTLNVIRAENGRYQLYLETKSKLNNNQKQTLPDIRGAEKSGKPVWRLGTDYTEEFNLTLNFCSDLTAFQTPSLKLNEVVFLLKQDDDYLNFKDEIDFNRKIKDKKYVLKYQEGEDFVHNNKFKASIYCKKAIGTLNDIIHQKIMATKEERLSLSEMLLRGLASIHKENIAHQDIKPENILIFRSNKGKLSLKITDFGISYFHQDKDGESMCSPLYLSPEISLSTLNLNSSSARYKTYHKGSLVSRIYANQIVYNSNKIKIHASYDFPHKLNDCWSAGIVLYQLYHFGHYPDYVLSEQIIHHNPLLKGLLEPERNNRLTATKAIQVFKDNKNLIFSTVQDFSSYKTKKILLLPDSESETLEELCKNFNKLKLSSNGNHKSDINKPK